MDKQIIKTSQAPSPIGPYSQGILIGNTLYISGQIAIDPSTGNLETQSIREETKRVMENLKGILAAAGAGFDNVVKTSIFLTDMNNFTVVNEVYGSYFSGNYPARETVQVTALPRGVNVEVSMIGYLNL